MQQNVQKSRITIDPRRSASVRPLPPVFSHPPLPASSGARTRARVAMEPFNAIPAGSTGLAHAAFLPEIVPGVGTGRGTVRPATGRPVRVHAPTRGQWVG